MKTKFPQSKRQKTITLIVVLVLLVAVAGALAYRQMAKTSSSQQHAAVTPVPSGKTSTNDTTVHAGPSHDNTPSPTVLPSNPSHPVTSTLAKPTGPYDNLHTVSLNGPIPPGTAMVSTCGTVAGASCFIQATMGSQVVKVSGTKTVADGAQGVELSWDAKQLPTGTWSIRAVAELNGQTASSYADTLTVTQ